MLDFSKTARRRKVYLSSGVKLLFLFLPWVFVAYGISTLQEFVSFYNNSVEASARVVFAESSDAQLSTDDARQLLSQSGNWPLPAFLYQHENGAYYVGEAIVDASGWRYHHGELVDVRYNRIDPTHAQPVNIFKFWWTPGVFIVGGLLVFFSLLIAFYKAENPRKSFWPKFKVKPQTGTLNLRRK